MTREEHKKAIIENLNAMVDKLEDDTEYFDALYHLGMLCEETEPCEDCISRAEAIKALEYNLSVEADGGLDKYRTVIKDLLNAIYNTQKKAIEDLPSIQPKPKTDVLDKIRAEIADLELGISRYHHYRPWIFRDEVLEIIDKYKTESEDKE